MTLEPDIAAKLRDLAHLNKTSFKQTLNEVLRRGLAAQEGLMTDEPPFVVDPHSGGFKPGVDLARLNQLADEIEVDDFVGETDQA